MLHCNERKQKWKMRRLILKQMNRCREWKNNKPQHGGPILCMVDTVVIASREKGKGKRRSTPWPLLAKLRSVCLS